MGQRRKGRKKTIASMLPSHPKKRSESRGKNSLYCVNPQQQQVYVYSLVNRRVERVVGFRNASTTRESR